MKKWFPLFLLLTAGTLQLNAQRDPLQWPFVDTSIWNMPIGSAAIYVHAQIEPAGNFGMTVDEDILFLDKDAPLVDIYTNYADWDASQDRCIEEGPLLFTAPITHDFLVNADTWDGLTPNSSTAFLMPDGETIKQTQPFARCTPATATSHYVPAEVNLFGDGITGAHGGSGLSAIGGTLRIGELDEPDDTIRHVLKVNLFAAENLFYDETTAGYRWPAIRSDGYAASVYGTQRTNPVVQECRMGALLALPIWMDLDSLDFETIPAQILARAFQQYGAYVVDDTAWDVYALLTEWSPNGRFTDEFEEAWGFSFKEPSLNTPWTRDIRKIFENLHVVANNAPGNRGGGGDPLVELAPPFVVSNTAEMVKSSIAIFPNPTTHFIQIKNKTNVGISKLSLSDWSGRVIWNAPVLPQLEIDLNGLPKGMYFLTITFSNGQIHVEEIVKM